MSMKIRLANKSDIKDLLEIEAKCWSPSLRASKDTILLRIATYPEGQFVLDVDGKARGILYTQRITNVEALLSGTYSSQFGLHTPSGDIVQFLAIAVDKSQKGAGVFLRDSALKLVRADATIKQVVAMSRCSAFKNKNNKNQFEEYEKHVMSFKDPTIHFHVSGGAEVVRIVKNYRPEDADNLKCAVMIMYPVENHTVAPAPKDWENLAMEVCKQLQLESGSEDEQEQEDLGALLDAPLLDTIDSLQTLTLVNWLEERMKVKLPVGFLFKAPSPRAIQEWFQRTYGEPAAAEEAAETGDSAMENEPLAIVGLACKLPGGIDTTEKLWNTMMDKACLSAKVPFGRWDVDSLDLKDLINDPAREQCVQHGCFVEDVDSFDPAFFGINKDETQNMDPNQRILLETVTKALYDSGKTKQELNGSNTGVWVGMSNSDYQDVPGAGFRDSRSVYGATGGAASVAAGRVSFLLGLNGPSLVVDTACSSSLVAINQACVALQRGQCSEAVVAGVNLMLAPWISVSYARAGMTSPDGTCHTFDEAANGYCRGEGCGAIVLKKLSEAIKDCDGIYAIVRGSAVLQDGKSASLTAPNGDAQARLLRAALKDANLFPSDVRYLEAHGTGTKLGDPFEVDAIATVFGKDRDQNDPLFVSSLKANIGHLEAAAGMAGLFSAILTLNHGYAPPNGQLKNLNGMVTTAIAGAPIAFPREATPLLRLEDQMLIAGVSSFGYSGTIAHVLIEEPPFDLRRTVKPHSACIRDHDVAVWQFAGEDSLYINVGRDLYEKSAAFRAGMDRCDAVVMDLLGMKASTILFPEDSFVETAEELLESTAFAQPLLVALQYATAEEWFTRGFSPRMVMGHSLGEYTAAVIAGVLSIEDCLKLVCARGGIVQDCVAPGGMMCAVNGSAEAMRRYIAAANTSSTVAVAAINGTDCSYLSGSKEGLERTFRKIPSSIQATSVDDQYAFHSPLMAPAAAKFAEVLKSVSFHKPTRPMVSIFSFRNYIVF